MQSELVGCMGGWGLALNEQLLIIWFPNFGMRILLLVDKLLIVSSIDDTAGPRRRVCRKRATQRSIVVLHFELWTVAS